MSEILAIIHSVSDTNTQANLCLPFSTTNTPWWESHARMYCDKRPKDMVGAGTISAICTIASVAIAFCVDAIINQRGKGHRRTVVHDFGLEG